MKKYNKKKICIFLLGFFMVTHAVEEIQPIDSILVGIKKLQEIVAVWQRIEKQLNIQYDKTEYPEIEFFRENLNQLQYIEKKQGDAFVLKEQDAKKIIQSWAELELLLLCAPRSYVRFADNVSRSSMSLDAYDIAKIKKFILTLSQGVRNIEIYRLFCGGSVANVIGNCNDTVITEITSADCVSIPQINALCKTIFQWLKTIVSELRGNQASCP